MKEKVNFLVFLLANEFFFANFTPPRIKISLENPDPKDLLEPIEIWSLVVIVCASNE